MTIKRFYHRIIDCMCVCILYMHACMHCDYISYHIYYCIFDTQSLSVEYRVTILLTNIILFASKRFSLCTNLIATTLQGVSLNFVSSFVKFGHKSIQLHFSIWNSWCKKCFYIQQWIQLLLHAQSSAQNWCTSQVVAVLNVKIIRQCVWKKNSKNWNANEKLKTTKCNRRRSTHASPFNDKQTQHQIIAINYTDKTNKTIAAAAAVATKNTQNCRHMVQLENSRKKNVKIINGENTKGTKSNVK